MEFLYEFYLKIRFNLSIFTELIRNAFGLRRSCKSRALLDGKVVVITGGNAGIGKETTLQLAIRNAKVIIGCRDIHKGIEVVQEIRDKYPNANICCMRLDLCSLKSVRHFAEAIEKIETKVDILINNAGIMMCPQKLTDDGFEMQIGTNHFGHFQLTHSLMPLLRKSPKARVITVSSIAHMYGKIHFENINFRNIYDPRAAYGQSKLANILFTRELAKRLGPQSNIKAYSLHPGLIRTDLWRYAFTKPIVRFMHERSLISTEMGAQTTLFCALEESLENETGYYYSDCKRIDDFWMVWRAKDDISAKHLWDMSTDLVKLEDNLKI